MKDILTHTSSWMNLEDIMLGEISPSQKDTIRLIPVIRGSWNVVKFIETNSSMVAARGWGRKDREVSV